VSDGNSAPVTEDVTVDVTNVPPVATASEAGSPATGVRAGASDSSVADENAGFTYRVDVGADGDVDETVNGGTSIDIPLDLPVGSTPVRVTATDKDGGTSAAAQTTLVRAPVVKCVVPKLKGKTKRKARRALRAANCTLGRVRKPRKARGKLVVSRQSPAAGTELAEGAAVNIRLKRKR
jgi:hypothetical protein